LKRLTWILAALAGCSLGALACSSGDSAVTTHQSTGGSGGTQNNDGGASGESGSGGSTASGGTSGTSGGTGGVSGSAGSASGGSGGSSSTGCGSGCPTGYTCGTANGIAVCRTASGVPLFTHVFLILMENTSLSTLESAMNGGNAPNFAGLAKKYASGSDYHGVAHPSLPNYIALTSGDTQGIGCDCQPTPQTLGCNTITCNLVVNTCGCDKQVTNLADQLDAVQKSWMAFGQDMNAPCNLSDSGNYAVRHVPFLYYDDIQKNAARCKAHVVDLSNFDPNNAPAFTYIAPNLINDMHNPDPAGLQNIKNGDAWIGPTVSAITASPDYTNGGLLVIVWDEDDGSGGITGTDDPIPIFVLSPYAKAGYVSQPKADHYSLLATIEDGLGLPRLGQASKPPSGVATTLSDYFPAQ
jgi:phosphatidylinositol-3-phosphatase